MILGSLIYRIGFLFVDRDRYQLYTENTLTPVTLVVTCITSLQSLLLVWQSFFLLILIEAGVGALFLARTGVFSIKAATVTRQLAAHAMEPGWQCLFFSEHSCRHHCCGCGVANS